MFFCLCMYVYVLFERSLRKEEKRREKRGRKKKGVLLKQVRKSVF